MDNAVSSIFTNQVGISFIVVWMIEHLKQWTKIPWITQHTDQLNRTLAVVVAFLSSVGFSVSISGSIWTGGHVAMDFPSLEVLLKSLIQLVVMFATQTGVQEGFYRLVIKKPTPVLVAAPASAPVAPAPGS
jgi:hypothetical protein